MKKKLIIIFSSVIVVIIGSISIIYLIKIVPYKTKVKNLTLYSLSEFQTAYGIKAEVPFLSSQINSLEEFDELFSTELVKKISNDKICVIYKLEDENKNHLLAYAIFREASNGYEKYWQKTGELHFISQKLHLSDYKNINIGESLINVINIDTAIIPERQYVYSYENDSAGYFKTFRFLEEGVLMLEFKNVSENEILNTEDFIVANKVFYPYNGSESLDLQLFDKYNLIEYLE